jgi:uracil-DNA glycosylase
MSEVSCLKGKWQTQLSKEIEKPYMQELRKFLLQENNKNKSIYPKRSDIFAAFKYTPLEDVKVVILGQDPYHGPGQAHGLCFSVLPDVATPPSLKNIYRELNTDLGIAPAKHGCLIPWAKQGVLLLNSVLTVEKGQAASHQGKGWEQFTDSVIKILNSQDRSIVFVLWGAYAQRKGACIDESKHLIIKSVHPSPLSAHRGYFGSRPFSKINDYLRSHNQNIINWELGPEAQI